ncbi:DM13 domain-containing protein [Flavobacterium sp. IMCC34852]|uniref:DM13 domain-containing protein n=1 Tax=Flavobacterium rivulicola TaxID=2732161 RepID=A0A7Y3W057_9FLAO|nr:DM13 domain-containing protein [Flavobacterium sp. IMCC34852]NNT73216.1 DM13 domain-containing protein [Flavobacterium sp. IMCC34852]
MKTILSLFTLLLLFTSCEVEGELTRDIVEEEVSNEAVLRSTGTFNPTGGISGSGTVKIYQLGNAYTLKLENYSISAGPDLKVYLSKADSPSDFVNLGNVNPDVTYSIPQQVNLADYPYVLIHCQQYNHLFAIAALQSN